MKNNSIYNVSRFLQRIICIALFVVLCLQMKEKIAQPEPMLDKVERVLASYNFKLEPQERRQFSEYLVETAHALDFDPLLILAIMKVESSFRPHVVSHVGAIGLLQVKMVAAKQVAKKLRFQVESENCLFDPYKNIEIGVQYLAYLRDRFEAHPARMLAAYNMGPTAVRRMKEVPMKYVYKVFRAYKQIHDIAQSASASI